MMKKTLLLLFGLLLSVTGAMAQDFVLSVNEGGVREYQLVKKFYGINFRLHISVLDYGFQTATGTAEVIPLNEAGYNRYISDYLGTFNEITYGSNDTYSGDIVIPSSVEVDNFTWGVGMQKFTFTVNKIAGEHVGNYGLQMPGAFQSNRNITSVTLPRTITSLPQYCFKNCTGLASFTVPSTISSIGSQAFAGCTNLKVVVNYNSSLDIRPGQNTYGNVALYADYVLTGSNIAYRDGTSGYLENGIVYTNSNKTDVIRYQGTATSVTLPSTVECIRAYAFAGCTSLTSITLPSSLWDIQASAFEGCTGLTSIEIRTERSVYIDRDAFKDCTSLTSFTTQNNDLILTRGGIFEGCTALRTVTIPGGLKDVPYRMFKGCTSLASVVFNDAVTTIGASAFEGCTYLGRYAFALPSNLTTIGDCAFKGAASTSISVLVLPSSVTTIGDEAFAACGVRIINLNDLSSMPTIGAGAFSNCPRLTKVVLPSGTALNAVPDRLFYGCSNLTGVSETGNNFAIAEGVTRIGHNAFEGTKLTGTITLPSTVTEIGYGAFANCSQLTGVELPSGLQQIDGYAFSQSGLTSVTVPASVERFGEAVFYRCQSLTEAVLPEQMKEIPQQMFLSCTALTSINLPGQLEKIGQQAFLSCQQLTEVTLPWSVKEIGNWAFANTGLTEIVIPNAVEKLGERAFRDCSNLWTVTMWVENPNEIEVGNAPFVNTPIETQTTTAHFNVPVNSLPLYRNHDILGEYGRLTAMTDLPSIELVEGQPYIVAKQMDANVTYKRTFNTNKWQALYIPFGMSVSQLSQFGEVAEISGMHSYQDEEGNESHVIEFYKLGLSSVINPNIPYVFRVKDEYVGQEIALVEDEEVTLSPAKSNYVSCSTTHTTYKILGVYERTRFDKCFALSQGNFVRYNNGATIGPYRFCMLWEKNKEGYPTPITYSAPARIKIMVDGEIDNDNTTGLEELFNIQQSNGQYYDLLGRPVAQPQKGHIYIVNGKKVLY